MPRPKLQEPTATRQRILLVAVDAFAEHGYSGASIRDICRRASVNVAALNYHWRSKAHLWHAVCEHCSRWVMQVVQDSVTFPLQPGAVLEQVVGGLFDALVADPRPARIMVWASLQSDSLNFDSTADTFQPLEDLCMDYIRLLRDQGRLGDVDAEMNVAIVQGALVYQIIAAAGHKRTYGKGLDDPEHAARVKTQLLRAARNVLGEVR